MAMSHKKFSAHRFFDAFQGFEDILELFVRQFNGRISVMPDAVSIESLKTYLASDSHDEGRSDFVEALYLIYDMSFGSAVTKEKYHEEFAQACVQMSPAYEPDPEGKLPLECLAMKVWSENRVAFDIAYTMHAFHSVDGFSEFKGPAGCEVGEPLLAADYLQTELERVFADNKKSDRVKVSFYHEQESINFIIYHEKRTIAELVFDDGKNIKAEILRPLQQDFIGYHPPTGKLSVKARFKSEVDLIRHAFARSCFEDEAHFDRDGASDRVNLAHLLEPNFRLETRDGDQAWLHEIWGRLKQKHEPRIMLRSRDVFQTIELNRLGDVLAADQISKAVIYLQFSGENRKTRIELTGSNGLKIPQTRYYDSVRSYLLEWGLIND